MTFRLVPPFLGRRVAYYANIKDWLKNHFWKIILRKTSMTRKSMYTKILILGLSYY